MSCPRVIVAFLVSGLLLAASPAFAHPVLATRHSAPVLGSKKVFHGYGVGLGTVKPKKVADGTDCGGVISRIHWTSWGGSTAHGTGLTCPNESRTRKLATIKLLPTAIRVCPGTHRRAYSKFFIRKPDGHGGFGPKKPWLGIKNYCG